MSATCTNLQKAYAKYNHSPAGKKRKRLYAKRKRNLLLVKRQCWKDRIIENGTEAQAKRYGCLKAWKIARGINPKRSDAMPKPARSESLPLKMHRLSFVGLSRWKKNVKRIQ